MNRTDRSGSLKATRQAGTTLILALVLLLLATLLALFAMNVGIFSQRTSAADLRARVIHQTLEGALAHGIEYIKNNRTAVISTMLNNHCTDTTFPCGTVPQCATAISGADSSGNTSDGVSNCTGDLQRRGHMFYYATSAGAGYDVNGNGQTDDDLDLRSLPIGTQLVSTAGNGFTVNYGIGAVMCMVKKPVVSTDPTECTTNPINAQGTYLFNMVAVGNISGESATAADTSANSTLSMVYAESPIAPGAGNPATLIASGSVDINGNGTFVTNPNGAGAGLPLTVWSPSCENTGGAGTVDSCYMEDWMRQANGYNSNSQYSFATNSDGHTKSDVVICSGNGNKTCSCSDTLSAGSGKLTEGIDVLTNDSRGTCTGNDPPVLGTTACTDPTKCKANYSVDESEFPCDLFDYIFDQSAWEDDSVLSPGTANAACIQQGTGVTLTGGGDCYCEKHKQVTYTVANGSPQPMGVDEAYLYAKALSIYDTDSTREPSPSTGWATSTQYAASCKAMVASVATTGGLIWDRTGSCLNDTSITNNQIGFPDKPVILVSDGSATSQGNIMFGLLFVRDTTPSGQSATKYGGMATYTGNSNGTIYGSVVVQGTAKANGTSAVVYNGTVMENLLNLDSNYSASPVPGSWTDRYAY